MADLDGRVNHVKPLIPLCVENVCFLNFNLRGWGRTSAARFPLGCAPFLSHFSLFFLQVYRKTNCPSYKEKFLFGLEASEFAKRSLTFYVYASDMYANTLIGEAELKLCDVTPRQPVTTWLTLTDTGQVSDSPFQLGGGGSEEALVLNFK